MNDREAIEEYDCAGKERGGVFPPIRWPHLALEAENCARLVEGVLDERFDCVRLAFGDEIDGAALGERLSEAWRTDALQTRFAPEGVFVRAEFSVLVEIAPEEDDDPDASIAETLRFAVEVCVSYTSRHHMRPFVDFMGGSVRRMGADVVMQLDPFAREVAPTDAVAWGLNGV